MTTHCDTTILKSPAPVRRQRPVPDYDDREKIGTLLDSQFEHLRAHSLFYRQIVRRRNGRGMLDLADLRHLPFTTREQLQEDQALHPPFGSTLATKPEHIARVHRTSGSSGQPLIIALSPADLEDTLRCGARCFTTAGVRPADLVVHCLNYCMWSGGVTDHEALERTGAGVIPYGVRDSSNLIRMILSLRPTGIHCTPSYLAKLEQRLADEFGLSPAALGLKLGLFGGEPGLQDPHFRARIERVWGFRAMDANYGMAEVLSIFGAECDVREGLHFMGQGVVYPELKNPAGDDVLPWEPGAQGELVLTHLSRECQPLLRYRTSDMIEVIAAGPCRCGLPSPRWRVVGRADDMVVVRGVNVYLSAIAEVVNARGNPLAGEYRVLVDRSPPISQCVVKVEVGSERPPDGLGDDLEDRLAGRLGVRVAVTLVPQGSLPRTEGKTRRLDRVL